QGGAAALDTAGDPFPEQVQQPRQAELDPDEFLVDLELTGDRLHHRRYAEIEPVSVPAMIHFLDIAGDLAADRTEPALDPALCLGAAKAVRDRHDKGLGRGHPDRVTPGSPGPLPTYRPAGAASNRRRSQAS